MLAGRAGSGPGAGRAASRHPSLPAACAASTNRTIPAQVLSAFCGDVFGGSQGGQEQACGVFHGQGGPRSSWRLGARCRGSTATTHARRSPRWRGRQPSRSCTPGCGWPTRPTRRCRGRPSPGPTSTSTGSRRARTSRARPGTTRHEAIDLRQDRLSRRLAGLAEHREARRGGAPLKQRDASAGPTAGRDADRTRLAGLLAEADILRPDRLRRIATHVLTVTSRRLIIHQYERYFAIAKNRWWAMNGGVLAASARVRHRSQARPA